MNLLSDTDGSKQATCQEILASRKVERHDGHDNVDREHHRTRTHLLKLNIKSYFLF
jgi:hypothetical protein